MRSPVCGFTPWRAPRSATENLPKPVIATSPPRCSVSLTTSVRAFTACSASDRLMSARSATCSISSDLFKSSLRNLVPGSAAEPNSGYGRCQSEVSACYAGHKRKNRNLQVFGRDRALSGAGNLHFRDEHWGGANASAERNPASGTAHGLHCLQHRDEVAGDGDLAHRLPELTVLDQPS